MAFAFWDSRQCSPLADTGDIEGITELVCHPGHVDDELRQTASYVEPREAELAALTHPSARELLNSEFIQLLNFGDLKLFAR